MRRLLALLTLLLTLTGCAQAPTSGQWSRMEPVGSMDLAYARRFQVDYYTGDLALVTIQEDGRYLLLPKGASVPEGLDDDIVVVSLPCEDIYLAASSAMDLFRAIDALDCVKLTSTQAADWTIAGVGERMSAGELGYVGKYSAPDYERVLSQGCTLAVESTMIYHKPQVKEQLESLGIPVLVEYSSYEEHPLGRLEWIRLYGLLTGRQQAAEQVFRQQAEAVERIASQQESGKTVAFFYVTANGVVNVRRPGDYVSKMIALAGGTYLLAEDGAEADSARSTMNMQMEEFYLLAKEADVLIYNGTVGGEIVSIRALLQLSPLFADFKAVQQGNVWCTGQNLFQQTSAVADTIAELHTVLSGGPEDGLRYLHRVQSDG